MMDGRVKTLHPKIHGGLLAVRDNAEHVRTMQDHHILGIDLLAVNLYPFEATVARGASFDDCIENIDIGGPAVGPAPPQNPADSAAVVAPADHALPVSPLSLPRVATPQRFPHPPPPPPFPPTPPPPPP